MSGFPLLSRVSLGRPYIRGTCECRACFPSVIGVERTAKAYVGAFFLIPFSVCCGDSDRSYHSSDAALPPRRPLTSGRLPLLPAV